MPVRPEIAERYETLDSKPAKLTWKGIDGFVKEMIETFGERSLEHAHALALYARKSRWTGTESARGRATMTEALAIAGEDLEPKRAAWWRLLLGLVCHQDREGSEAKRWMDEAVGRAQRGKLDDGIIHHYRALAGCMRAWGEPVDRALDALMPVWANISDEQRTEAINLLKDVQRAKPEIPEAEGALVAALSTSPTSVKDALAARVATANPSELQRALADLDRMTGLSGVKRQIHRLVAQLRLREARRAAGLPVPEIVHHMAFLGPPGTGKTTVARLLGRIFKALGILPSDKVVETDRSGLIGQFIGQTAPAVNAKVDEAIGGVLFIDEAYALSPTDSNDFGHEAISTLVKRMEDDRSRVAVVLAGYADEMQVLLDTNPGLRSRIPTVIAFHPYSSPELFAILQGMFADQGFVLTNDAEGRCIDICELLRGSSDDRTFGNARGVRNVVDETIASFSVRLVPKLDAGETLSREELTRIEVEDITWSELGDPALAPLDEEHAALVAVHEAGHALVRQVAGAPPPILVTIVPSTHALGRTFYRDERKIILRSDLIAIAASALGGRAAEEEVYGAPSAGAMGDLGMAERILFSALKAGLSEDVSEQALDEFVMSGSSASDHSTMSTQARQEVAEMLAEAWTFARKAVREHRSELDALAHALVTQRVLDGERLRALLPAPPQVVPRTPRTAATEPAPKRQSARKRR